MAEEDHQEREVSQEQVVPQESIVFPPSAAPKTSWPELVGLAAEVAERKIKEEMPAVRIQVVPPDCFVTTDFNEQRVRLYLDSSQNVVSPPKTG